MEQEKRSTFKLLFYLKKNEPKKNGNVPVMGRITIDGIPKSFSSKLLQFLIYYRNIAI